MAHGKNEHHVASTAERGDLLRLIKSWALKGYLESGDEEATKEKFEKMWREAFHADIEVGEGGNVY